MLTEIEVFNTLSVFLCDSEALLLAICVPLDIIYLSTFNILTIPVVLIKARLILVYQSSHFVLIIEDTCGRELDKANKESLTLCYIWRSRGRVLRLVT